ncbi:MAG: DUF3515 domain-containing protein [Haloechinothrix sp.]
MHEQSPSGAPPRALIIIAVLLGVALAASVAVLGLSRTDDASAPAPVGPLPLVPVDAPESGSPECAALIDALPDELPSRGDSLARRRLAEPAPEASAAWGTSDPVVLRCGLGRPPELEADSRLQVINGVQWLTVAGQGVATWFTVDRDVFVALTITEASGTGPLQAVSDAVSSALRPVPPRS